MFDIIALLNLKNIGVISLKLSETLLLKEEDTYMQENYVYNLETK